MSKFRIGDVLTHRHDKEGTLYTVTKVDEASDYLSVSWTSKNDGQFHNIPGCGAQYFTLVRSEPTKNSIADIVFEQYKDSDAQGEHFAAARMRTILRKIGFDIETTTTVEHKLVEKKNV